MPAAAQAESVVPITSEPHHHLLLQNDYTRVFKVDVPPHASTLMHQHEHAYIYVVLGSAEIENNVQGKPPAKVRFADGETKMLKGGFAPLVRNLAETPFRNVTIESASRRVSSRRSRGSVDSAWTAASS